MLERLGINQTQFRKIGCILMASTVIYTFPWTRSILSILDKPIYGTIVGAHIVAGLAGYFVYLVWYRQL